MRKLPPISFRDDTSSSAVRAKLSSMTRVAAHAAEIRKVLYEFKRGIEGDGEVAADCGEAEQAIDIGQLVVVVDARVAGDRFEFD